MTQRLSKRYPSATMLLVLSLAGLVALDLIFFTIATAVGAAALVVFALVYLTRDAVHTSRAGFYGFLIAEASPLGLQPDLITALGYQALCLLFLTAMIAPFPHVSASKTYVVPGMVTVLIAAIALALGAALAGISWLTPIQATALAGIVILGGLAALLYVLRHDNDHHDEARQNRTARV